MYLTYEFFCNAIFFSSDQNSSCPTLKNDFIFSSRLPQRGEEYTRAPPVIKDIRAFVEIATLSCRYALERTQRNDFQ